MEDEQMSQVVLQKAINRLDFNSRRRVVRLLDAIKRNASRLRVFRAMAAAVCAREIRWAPGYFANHAGLIFSSKKRVPNQGLLVLRPRTDGEGYSTYGLCVGDETISARGHRLVADCFLVEPTGELPVVRHLNGDPRDNRLDNLQRSTQLENIHDKWYHGTMATGERNGARTRPDRVLRGEDASGAKLSDAIVLAIKRRLADGERGADLAREHGVAKTTISAIKTGRNRSLPGNGKP